MRIGYALVVVLGLAVAVQAADEKFAKWSGLIKEGAVGKLPKPTEKENFAFGLITDGKTLDAFVEDAGLKGPKAKEIDWDKQAVVFVILKKNTNSVSFKDWQVKEGKGEFTFTWNMIEPAHNKEYPALLHCIDKKDLKKITVKYDGAKDNLGEIEVK